MSIVLKIPQILRGVGETLQTPLPLPSLMTQTNNPHFYISQGSDEQNTPLHQTPLHLLSALTRAKVPAPQLAQW